MPTLQWLKKEFDYGYDSGNVLSLIPDKARRDEEKRIGASYRQIFRKAVMPCLEPHSKVLELGPGRGSWSRPILKHIPYGQLHTVDFQDVTRWLMPEKHDGQLICHTVEDSSFSCLEDDYFDFFWSFGVLCHHSAEQITEILRNTLPKMKPNAAAVHQYADWDKLDACGWTPESGVPAEFKNLPDDQIWWPRNNPETMTRVCQQAGWLVESADLGLADRDSIIRLRKPP